MPLKVIGAGLGRTGTLSLKAALEELGFSRCYHMVEVLANPDHVVVWEAAARGEAVDWDALFHGYQAAVDWPACNFYQEYLRLYPDAKVVLTVRDPEGWYASARATIYGLRHAFPTWALAFIPWLRRFHRMTDRVIWEGVFQGRFEDKSYALEVFNHHNAEVMRVVPADRLLVFEVSQGWGPLCQFLGAAVPSDKPFPRLNDAAEFRARIFKGVVMVRAVACVVVGLAAALAWLGARWIRLI